MCSRETESDRIARRYPSPLSLAESVPLFENLLCSPGECVGLQAHENKLAVIMASAMGFCVTLPLTNL